MRKFLKNSSFGHLSLLAAIIILAGMSWTASSSAQETPASSPETVSAPADASLASPSSAIASDTTAASSKEALPPEVLILNKIEEELKEKYKNDIYIPPSIPSLFFTSEQQSLLREARNGFNTRIPVLSETEQPQSQPKLTSEARKLSLGGIVFINPDEWTIWLNKKRISSVNLPTEAVDLRVYKEFIELKWFDAQTNQIFPIRLRPNQTFNLETHTFVPG